MHPKAALIKMTSGIDYKIMVSLHYEFLSGSSGVIEKITLGIEPTATNSVTTNKFQARN